MKEDKHKYFQENYKKILESEGVLESVNESDIYVNDIEKAISKMVEQMKAIGGTDKGIKYRKGDIAEPWHSGSYNIDAVTKGVDNEAQILRSTEFGSPDVVDENGRNYGIKYYKDSASTAKAQTESFYERYMQEKKENESFEDYMKDKGYLESENLKHTSIYEGQIRIVPADQLIEIKEYLQNKIIKESLKRPELVEKYREALANIDDRIKGSGGTEGIPLTEHESRLLAQEIKDGEFDRSEWGLNSENFIRIEDLLREAGGAAVNAALITAVLKSAPKLIEIINDLIHDEGLDNEKLKKLGTDFIRGSIEGGLRGAIAASITISSKSGLLGESFKNLSPNVIAAVTVITINAIKNSFQLYKGEISKEEFAEMCIKNSFIVGFGIFSASIGQTLMPIPIFGALIGNFVGSLCAVAIYEGSKKVFFSFFIKTGFSFFFIVKQDYTLPREVLEKMGFDLIELKTIEFDTIELDTIELDTVELDTMDISVLKRGLISVNTIGYI